MSLLSHPFFRRNRGEVSLSSQTVFFLGFGSLSLLFSGLLPSCYALLNARRPQLDPELQVWLCCNTVVGVSHPCILQVILLLTQHSFCFFCSSATLLTHVQLVVPSLLTCCLGSWYSSVSARPTLGPLVLVCFHKVFPIWQDFVEFWPCSPSQLAVICKFDTMLFIPSSGHSWKCCIAAHSD